MNELRNATLVFLIKKTDGQIKDICLALKKRGFGIHRWNGVGGKVNGQSETIEEAARREAKEEILVDVQQLHKVAELTFYFPHHSAWDQMVHVYLAEQWRDEPRESDEMKPEWFSVNELPFQEMWPDDIFWLPDVLKGHLLKAMFTFGEQDVVRDKKVEMVQKFS
ncbi:8-oxo-dGTP diphosphatase [Candidatus Parcubacteria bacterium]|nr:8-oxo-dGTP diphosphatase [Candidatus Parcubacteria bacterium]